MSIKRAVLLVASLLAVSLPASAQVGNPSTVLFGGSGVDGFVLKGTLSETLPLQINSMNFQQMSGTTYQPISGTVVNCRTSMSILGTMIVQPGTIGGTYSVSQARGNGPSASNAGGGGNAGYGGNTLGPRNSAVATIEAGSSGASGTPGTGTAGVGGTGGGFIKINSLGQIVIGPNAILSAAGGNGTDGSANTASQGGFGGSGGSLILTSRDRIVNNGTITVAGGNGGGSSTTAANSSGGGGGYVVLIAPIVSAGTVVLTGGAAGAGGSGTAGEAGADGKLIVLHTLPELTLMRKLNAKSLERLAIVQDKMHRYLTVNEIDQALACK